MRANVVVVGSANADLVLDIDHRPRAGETILGSDIVVTPGGKGANQAVAAGLLGGQVAFVGCVGDDSHGALLRGSLTRAGVDVSQLRTVEGASGHAIIMVTPDGENSIIVSPAANRQVTPELLAGCAELWRRAAVVVLQLEIPLVSVEYLAREAEDAGARVVLNLAPAAVLASEVLAVADPLVVNESEAAFLMSAAGRRLPADPLAAARELRGLGPRSVVLTLGARGVVLDDGAEHVHVPALPVTVVDTTGAGDAFVGALAVGLAQAGSLTVAVERAVAVAALTVGRRGAQASYPTREELASADLLLAAHR